MWRRSGRKDGRGNRHERSGEANSKQALPNGTAKASEEEVAQSFPTEQSLRQKAVRKLPKEELEKAGKTKQGIKKLMGKRPQPQEQVSDIVVLISPFAG